jgi:hypothetical protein
LYVAFVSGGTHAPVLIEALLRDFPSAEELILEITDPSLTSALHPLAKEV